MMIPYYAIKTEELACNESLDRPPQLDKFFGTAQEEEKDMGFENRNHYFYQVYVLCHIYFFVR